MTRALTFEAPGKGCWEMDATHCPKPLVGVLQEVFADGLGTGIGISAERYGLLLERLVVRYVHGFPYVQPKPVGAPAGGTSVPPKFLFKLATWLHPEMRRRLKRAETLFEDKPWLAELQDWDERVKPKTVAGHLEMAAQDPAAMSDAELADHIRAFVARALDMVIQDHSYDCTFMVPLGDYLARAGAWTGADGGELMAILRGHADASSGDLIERRRFLEALADDEAAQRLLHGDAAPEQILAELEADPGPLGEALSNYLLFTGGGALGIDMTRPSLREQPELLVPALRALLDAPAQKQNGVAEQEKALRARVPAEQRAAFDEMLADVRKVYRLRDERHTYGAVPLIWLGRRLLLEVGRRLEKRGELTRPELALHAFSFELVAHLEGRAKLNIDELETRAAQYEQLDGWSVPATFGPEPTKPPSDWLPPGARRAMEALDSYFHHANRSPEPRASKTEVAPDLRGLGVSQGTREGTARLCVTDADLTRIERGDILVAQTTCGAIHGALPLLAGIVTDRGGALSHAAIVCREYGIPGVVGTKQATQRIQDGDRIRVDGTLGEVVIL